MDDINIENLSKYHSLGSIVISDDENYAAFSVTDVKNDMEGYSSSIWIIDLKKCISNRVANNTGKKVSFIDNSHVIYSGIREKKDEELCKKGFLLTVIYEYDIINCTERELFRVSLNNAEIWHLYDNKYLIKSRVDNNRPDFENMNKEECDFAMIQYELDEDYIVCTELPFAYDGSFYTSGKRNKLFIYDKEKDILELIGDNKFDADIVCVLSGGKEIIFSGFSYTKLKYRCQGIYIYNIDERKITEIIKPGIYQIMGLSGTNKDNIMVAAEEWDGIGPFPNHHLFSLEVKNKKLKRCYQHTEEDFGLKTCTDTRLGPGTTFFVENNILWYIVTKNNSSMLAKYTKDNGYNIISKDEDCIDYFSKNNNTMLCIAYSGKGLQEIYKINLITGELSKITHINDNIIEKYNIYEPEPVSFINKDGIRIDGFVVMPKEFDERKKYPGILEIHGGPRASYSKIFNHEMQVLAAKGYFVFYCNPRGSSGRGEDFAESRGIRGTIDYSDIMEFCDFIIDKYPSLDKKRIGVTGGSYGGFMVNWIIGHTNRFAAAVSMRSLADFIADFGSADHSMWGDKGILQGDPWNDTEKLWDESPLKYAFNVKTPTLFLHSTQDMRCPLVHAQQMYSVLMWNGVETRMCIFKDECHELSRSGKPRHRVRRLKELVQWMDKYLK